MMMEKASYVRSGRALHTFQLDLDGNLESKNETTATQVVIIILINGYTLEH